MAKTEEKKLVENTPKPSEEAYKDLSGKTLKELLTIKDSLSYLIEYYDNYAQANTGNYEYDTKEIYNNAKNMSLKYGKALSRVIQAIAEKVNGELYK